MNYSRRQLEALGEPFGESATQAKPGGRIYGAGGGGGGSTSSTVYQNSIPKYLEPYAGPMLGATMQQLFNTSKDSKGNLQIEGFKPYVPYSANPQDYVAGFSPLQQQVQYNAANLQMPGQFQQGTRLANMAGMGGLESAQRAYDYGNMGANYGGMGAGYGQRAANIGEMALQAQDYGRMIGSQAQDYAAQAAGMGDLYGQMATDPRAYQAYMSPYQQNVTDLQVAAAQRQADIAAQGRKTAATRAGAFGGARQAIENAEANRALQTQLDAIQAQGLQSAYTQAQQNINQRAALGLQGLSGAQAGLGTALQGGQLGLSGIGQAIAGQQAGMQGAGVGIQGAQAGLQGVSGAQSGYGLANQAAGTLGSLGTQQLAGQTGILGLQNQIGAEQQARQQAITDAAINNYAQAQAYPQQQLSFMNAMLRGLPTESTTASTYRAGPAMGTTAATIAAAARGISGTGRKAGGQIKTGGIERLALRKALGGKA